MLKVLDVDGAVRRVRGGWEATGQEWRYDADRYERVAQTREAEQQSMLAYVTSDGCRLQYLRQALDDPHAEPCGRCDNCGGLALDRSAAGTAVEQAGARLGRPGVTVDPRRMWPSAMLNLGVDLGGKIPVDEQARPGRAVARLTDLGWGQQLRALLAGPDGEVPVPLRHALADVLAAWDLAAEERPDGIVGIGSSTRPLLVGHLVDGLARFTGLPVLTSLAVTGGALPGAGAMNSAQRLAAVATRYTLLDPEAVTGRRVLLLDDQVVTGWTLAVAARALRRAGALSVHPLVLATAT
jgi:ATP-dependent DNA helicase RecQ